MDHVIPAEEILEVVEIEIFALEEKPLPRARHYVIRVDKEKVTVDRPEITGAEILALVGKTPASSSSMSTVGIISRNRFSRTRRSIFMPTISSVSPPCRKARQRACSYGVRTVRKDVRL
jgi:hypothetical protein